MELSRETDSVPNAVTAYAPGAVRIAGVTYAGGLIATRQAVVGDWRPSALEALTIADFAPLLAAAPDIAILGTGPRQRLPSPGLYADFAARRIGLEVMDSAAACRTYNLLLSEYREVALALLP